MLHRQFNCDTLINFYLFLGLVIINKEKQSNNQLNGHIPNTMEVVLKDLILGPSQPITASAQVTPWQQLLTETKKSDNDRNPF